jgi:hypothetical protein
MAQILFEQVPEQAQFHRFECDLHAGYPPSDLLLIGTATPGADFV